MQKADEEFASFEEGAEDYDSLQQIPGPESWLQHFNCI